MYEISDRLMLVVHGERPPLDADWDDYLAALQALPEPPSSFLVVTDNVGPNARQRARLNELASEVSPRGEGDRILVPVAVVTHSAVARGVVTALGWFNAGIKAFAPTALPRAFEHIGITPERRLDIQQRILRMRISLAMQAEPAMPAPDLTEVAARMNELMAKRLPALRAALTRR